MEKLTNGLVRLSDQKVQNVFLYLEKIEEIYNYNQRKVKLVFKKVF